jgi:rhodanese-related sulfurtransferase
VRFRGFGEAFIIIALACLPAIGEGFYFRDKVSWQSAIPASELVTVEQARAWGDTAIWVDARPDDEFAAAHVPGAFSLNEDRWNELLPQFLPNWSLGKKVVVYCSAQSCNAARDVAKRLRDEAQLKDVFVLQGGWEEWMKKNR